MRDLQGGRGCLDPYEEMLTHWKIFIFNEQQIIHLQVCYRTLLHVFERHQQHVRPPDKLLDQQGVQAFSTKYWSAQSTGQAFICCNKWDSLAFQIQGSKWTLSSLWRYLHANYGIERKPIWDQGIFKNTIFFVIINFAAVEDIVIRSILSTKEKLQTQWKTVVVRKIEYSSAIYLGQLSI